MPTKKNKKLLHLWLEGKIMRRCLFQKLARYRCSYISYAYSNSRRMCRKCLFIATILSMSLATEPANADSSPIAAWDARKAEPRTLPDQTGHGHDATLHGVQPMQNQDDLVERAYLFFRGEGEYASIAPHATLNPNALTLSVWFQTDVQMTGDQIPLAVKSSRSHHPPYYQYGLFVMNKGDHPQSLIAYASVNDKLVIAEAKNVTQPGRWQQAVMTYDGKELRLYCDGRKVALQKAPGTLDRYDTPFLIGAYGNLPKTAGFCFKGAIARVVLEPSAVSLKKIRKRHVEGRKEFAADAEVLQGTRGQSPYAARVNAALGQKKDIWTEAMIADGGVTYEAIKDYLQPLFYSTGWSNKELGVHNLLFGEDGGKPPFLIPIADGSRIVANRYNGNRDLTFYVGPRGAEKYGSSLARLRGPKLESEYYPILQTGYVDAAGVRYTQECFAGSLAGSDHLLAFVKITAHQATPGRIGTTLRFDVGGPRGSHLRSSLAPAWNGPSATFKFEFADRADHTLYLLWSPDSALPETTEINEAVYQEARNTCKTYWDNILRQGATFEVPEQHVMNVQRNLLIQNRIMRWRYSLGSVVYHNSFFLPESSDAMTVLGYYGYEDDARDGIDALVGMTKGKGMYVNWERGEKLSHAAHEYFITRDPTLIRKHTTTYVKYLDRFKEQMQDDPHGLLRKERFSGDIPEPSYCIFHQAVCWRGIRDLTRVWKILGETELHDRYAPLAAQLKTTLLKAVEQSSRRMADGSLFVHYSLLEPADPFDPITETRLGSYWNLCMPYAFASGLWEPGGPEMRAICKYMHEHGAVLLGLLRFNYYPTPIGSHRNDGLPGYRTTGFDNVYLLNYARMLAENDMPERLIASFYGKIAHGQTRGTYVCGEGATVGPEPDLPFRSCYGTPNSANNSTFLLMLRLMLIRESFNWDSGIPEGLHLAAATPRSWLEHGKQIVVRNAPTCFGLLSYTIQSHLKEKRIRIIANIPDRNPIQNITLHLRVPGQRNITEVQVNGVRHVRFDRESESIDLTGHTGEMKINVDYKDSN